MERLQRRYLALRASHGRHALDQPEGLEMAERMSRHRVQVGPFVFASAASIATWWDVVDALAFGGRDNLLIVGERGVGKEAIALAVGETLEKPEVSVNCATLVASLADAELFGVGGSSGLPGVPRAGTEGFVQRAGDGVLFLDEIFEAPHLYPKLLRLLQQRSYSRVADPVSRQFDGTIIAASNRYPDIESLEAAKITGEARPDLVDRFLVVEVAPLRKRLPEIGQLAEHFLKQLAEHTENPFVRLSTSTSTVLSYWPYPWPGNLRELNSFLQTQAQLRRHQSGGPELHIPGEVVRRLLPLHDATEIDALSAWTREGVRHLRRSQLLEALRLQKQQEHRDQVDADWVGRTARALLDNPANISEKLKSAGTTCSALARALSHG